MKRLLPLFILCIATGAQAAGQTAGGNWLVQAAQAVRDTSYTGVLVYLRGGQMNTLRIAHRYRDGHERERVVALSGQPREVIRKNNVATCILPKKKIVITTQHARSSLLSRFANVSSDRFANYEISVQGDKRLAGRMCRVILVKPQDKYRYGYRLVMDKKTNLPLKFELLNDKRVLEQMMFTSVSYPESIPDSVLQQTLDTHGFQHIKNLPNIENKTSGSRKDIIWHATQLPAGYHLAATGIHGKASAAPVRQLLFTDGIATVSAFIAPVVKGHEFTGATSMGAVNAYGRVKSGSQITVVGQVPGQTVRSIAEHMTSGKDSPVAKQ